MKAIRILLFIVFANMLFHPSVYAQQSSTLFTATPPSSTTKISRILSFTSSLKKDRVLLSWSISDNEDANRFELERSLDGKEFVMAALIFGTDKVGTDNYQFLEKEKYSRTYYYRIRIIGKNGRTIYSDAINAGPDAIK
jgi:hypothetical protein